MRRRSRRPWRREVDLELVRSTHARRHEPALAVDQRARTAGAVGAVGAEVGQVRVGLAGRAPRRRWPRTRRVAVARRGGASRSAGCRSQAAGRRAEPPSAHVERSAGSRTRPSSQPGEVRRWRRSSPHRGARRRRSAGQERSTGLPPARTSTRMPQRPGPARAVVGPSGCSTRSRHGSGLRARAPGRRRRGSRARRRKSGFAACAPRPLELPRRRSVQPLRGAVAARVTSRLRGPARAVATGRVAAHRRAAGADAHAAPPADRPRRRRATTAVARRRRTAVRPAAT